MRLPKGSRALEAVTDKTVVTPKESAFISTTDHRKSDAAPKGKKAQEISISKRDPSPQSADERFKQEFGDQPARLLPEKPELKGTLLE